MRTKSILISMGALLLVFGAYTVYISTNSIVMPETEVAQVDLVLSEQTFLDAYISHQEAAVVDAQMMLEQGTRLRPLLDIATTIVADKQLEAEYLKGQYQNLYDKPYTRTSEYVSPLQYVSVLSAVEFERTFLETMIQHHERSILLIQKSEKFLMSEEIIEFSQKSMTSEQIEIGNLRDVLQLLPQD